MSFSYAGIGLTVPTPEALEWMEAHVSVADLFPWAAYRLGPRRVAWTYSYQELHRPVEVGTLYWPSGASRWAVGCFLASTDQLNQIDTKVYAGGKYQAQPLILGDDKRQIKASLWMLPPRPLAQIPNQQGLWLLPLVDARYWWWFNAGLALSVTTPTTYASILSQIATALGVTISSDPIPSAYANASESLTSYYEDLPLLLDTVAWNIGQRVVVGLDGTVTLQSAATARTLVQTQWGQSRPVLAGGPLDLEPYSGTPLNMDFPGVLPSAVQVIFPKSIAGAAATPPVAVTVPFSTLSVPGLSQARTSSFIKTIHETASATYTTGGSWTNQSTLEALATQIATDWYSWQASWLDVVFTGIADWAPEGLSDSIVWTYRRDHVATRVQRPPYNDVVEEAMHSPYVAGTTSSSNASYTYYTDTFNSTSDTWNISGDTWNLSGGTTWNVTGGTWNFQGGVTVNFVAGNVYFDGGTTVYINGSPWTFEANTTWSFNANISLTWSGDSTTLLDFNMPVLFCGYFAECWYTVYAPTGGDITDYPAPNAPMVPWKPTGNSTLHGLIPISTRQRLRIVNTSSTYYITLKHLSTTETTAARRMSLPGLVDLILSPGDSVDLLYSPTDDVWYVTGSSSTGTLQGYPISPTGPSTNDVLLWNGTFWTPGSLPTTGPSPNAPTALAGTAGNAQVAWSWTAPASGQTPSSYWLQIATNSTFTTGVQDFTGLASTSKTTTGLTNGTTYYARVCGVYNSAAGPWSSSASATPSAGGGGPALVQALTIVPASSGVTSLQSGSFPGSVTAGNLIVVAIMGQSPNAISGVTDTLGNTYTAAKTSAHSSGNDIAAIYYTHVTTGGASNKVTVTFTGTANITFQAMEFSGLTPAVDVSNSSTGSGTSPSTGSVTTTTASELLVAVVASSGNTSFTVPTGFTSGGNETNPSDETGDTAYEIVSSIQTGINPTWTTNVGGAWATAIVTFK